MNNIPSILESLHLKERLLAIENALFPYLTREIKGFPTLSKYYVRGRLYCTIDDTAGDGPIYQFKDD